MAQCFSKHEDRSNPAAVQNHPVILFKDLGEDGQAAFLRKQCSGNYAVCVSVCMFPGKF